MPPESTKEKGVSKENEDYKESKAFRGHKEYRASKQGERGDSGIITTINGFYALTGDKDGNLYAICADDDNPPQFETDDEGNVYVILPDE